MGDFERQPYSEGQQNNEILDPHHFYAAYIFDRASEREQDVQAILETAKGLDYPVRYWWLSNAMEIEGYSDRLIICVHHASSSEEAGMDLYEALKEKGITWDDLEAAAMDEYQILGKVIQKQDEIRLPNGYLLFPDVKGSP